MISQSKGSFLVLKGLISREKRIIREMSSVLNYIEKLQNRKEKEMISHHLNDLKNAFRDSTDKIKKILNELSLSEKTIKPLEKGKEGSLGVPVPKFMDGKKHPTEGRKVEEKSKKKPHHFLGSKKFLDKLKPDYFEKETLKRLRKEEKKIVQKKVKKPSMYIKTSNKIFSNLSISLMRKGYFKNLERDLIKANMQFLPKSYVSVIFLTTILSAVAGLFIFLFFLFFSIGPELPIITMVSEPLMSRFLKIFWIIFAIPLGTLLIMYFYPSMEKRSAENKIDQELPFATIHMAAISGSMIDPTKIFSIIISTKEYPFLEREFTKLINEINLIGKDLVSALRNNAFNSPSKKLSELFNGLATTISSGGNLPEFFEKRSQSLLFEYRLEREKYTRSAETFMDIYISVVIAAPMILMLLLIMMKISGLGISLSTTMITLVMVLGVTVINAVFLTFLHLRQPTV